MRHSAILATKVACATKARGDATLQALLGGSLEAPRYVDGPRKQQAFPFITPGNFTELADDTIGRNGVRITGRFFGYSDKNETEEIGAIANRFLELFDGSSLSISGFNHIYTEYKKTEEGILDDSGRLIRMVGMEFEITATEAAS